MKNRKIKVDRQRKRILKAYKRARKPQRRANIMSLIYKGGLKWT
jgi:hypothetical protein